MIDMSCAIGAIVVGAAIGLLTQILMGLGLSSDIAYLLAIALFVGAVWKYTSDPWCIHRWRRRIGLCILVFGLAALGMTVPPAAAGVETATPPSPRSEPSALLPRGVAVEMLPVNTRSDGSIRHRQHHPVDFPPKR